MSYTPLEWKDGPQGGTPITAAALNRMEQGIVDAHAVIDAATPDAEANTLVRRDSNGRASVVTPTSASHIATKGYVDDNFARIYPTIYSVDFDGPFEIEAGGFIQRVVAIQTRLTTVRVGVSHTLPPSRAVFSQLNNLGGTGGASLTSKVKP